jgi:hypothetical protein
MTGTTLHIINNLIVINLEEIDQDTFCEADKQTIVFLTSLLGGYNINYTNRTITLYLTLETIGSYMIDFDRGGIDTTIANHNFETAIAKLTGK